MTTPAIEPRREIAQTLGAATLVLAFGLLLVSLDPLFFWHDDHQLQYLAGLRDAARALTAGEWPLLSPYSWLGGALAAEYQYGVFSLFLQAANVAAWSLGLTLPATAAFLALLHLTVLAAGAYRLGRGWRLTPSLALMVAVAASLNGWILHWGASNWAPALFSFAWLPWFWTAAEKALGDGDGPLRFVPAGLFLYLLLTAGWPFTVLMALMICVWLAWRRVLDEGHMKTLVPALWPLVAAGLLGVGLASPALLMLVEYTGSTLRSNTGLVAGFAWSVPMTALVGLVLPTATPQWFVWDGWWERRPALELAGGLVPLAGLVLASVRRRRFLPSRRREIVLLLGVAALLLLPGFSTFKFTFRWLPLFHLVLALLGAQALAEMSSRRSTPWRDRLASNPGAITLALVALAWLGVAPTSLASPRTTELAGELGLLAGLWLAVEELDRGRRLRAAMPAVVTLVALFAVYLHTLGFASYPVWRFDDSLRDPAPLRRDLRYLAIYRWRDLYIKAPHDDGANFRPGSTPLYAELDFVNGYSPMLPSALASKFGLRVHGDVANDFEVGRLKRQMGHGKLVELMAVDGLILPRDMAPELDASGWSRVARLGEAVVFHRDAAPTPRIRSVELALARRDGLIPIADPADAGALEMMRFAPARIERFTETRNTAMAEVEVPASGDALVVFARLWHPGYRARLAEEELTVEVASGVLPAVRLPAGQNGRLELTYRPRSLTRGIALAVLTLATLGTAAALTRRRR